MANYLVAEQGQTFFCGGGRFSIYETVDCFALIIVQYGNDFELALLGLARFRQPRDLSAKPLCYVEMQILMSLNPKDGYFKLQALLTSNSWILNKDCKLTGGFALFVWFDGPTKAISSSRWAGIIRASRSPTITRQCRGWELIGRSVKSYPSRAADTWPSRLPAA